MQQRFIFIGLKFSVFLILLGACSVRCNPTSTCGQKDMNANSAPTNVTPTCGQKDMNANSAPTNVPPACGQKDMDTNSAPTNVTQTCGQKEMGVCTVRFNVTSICGQKEMCNSHLNLTIDLNIRENHSLASLSENQMQKALDCADVLQSGNNRSGIYQIWPINRLTEGKPLFVYCDMVTNGGGWTVIQRRGDFHRLKDFFYKDWKSYKEGFGQLEEDFWLGNDNIFALTNQKLYSARFDLKDVQQNKRYALYDKFWIDDESNKYTLHISDYSGDAGDQMTWHDRQRFSTKDQDNDNNQTISCAIKYKGGWWYNACHNVNLNGLYYRGKYKGIADGVYWHNWTVVEDSIRESLEWTEIKIRPKNFNFFSASEVTASEVTPV